MTQIYETPEAETTTAPYVRKIGHECEYGFEGCHPDDESAEEFMETIKWANEKGYAKGGPFRRGYRRDDAQESLLLPTHEHTAGGEWIIGGLRGVVFGSEVYMRAITAMEHTCKQGLIPIHMSGMHTHVDASDLNAMDRWRTIRNYMLMEPSIAGLARFDYDQPRDNCHQEREFELERWAFSGEHSVVTHGNVADVSVEELTEYHSPGKGHPIAMRAQTLEVRVWNSTTDAWRMYLAGAVSSALVEASKDGNDAEHNQPVEEFLFDYLTDDLIPLIDRQRNSPATLD